MLATVATQAALNSRLSSGGAAWIVVVDIANRAAIMGVTLLGYGIRRLDEEMVIWR